jgi:hypothetical protein
MQQENQCLRTATQPVSSPRTSGKGQSGQQQQQQLELDRLRLELALLDVQALCQRGHEIGVEPRLIEEALARTEMSPKDSLIGLIVAKRSFQLDLSDTEGDEKRPPMYVPPQVQGP